MELRAKLVLPTANATWVSNIVLPIAPFPGMGIRLDAYDIVTVISVVVGDIDSDVTCIVEIEGVSANEVNDEQYKLLGFEIAPNPCSSEPLRGGLARVELW